MWVIVVVFWTLAANGQTIRHDLARQEGLPPLTTMQECVAEGYAVMDALREQVPELAGSAFLCAPASSERIRQSGEYDA